MTATLDDRITWNCHLQIDKFKGSDLLEAEAAGLSVVRREDIFAAGIDPYEVLEVEPANLLVSQGINWMLQLLGATATPTAYSLSTARVCVGDGGGTVPTATAADTALTATTNRYNQSVQASTGVVVTGTTITFTSVFSTSVANFVWNEWGIDSGGASGAGAASGLLNHKGVNLGTKSSAASWTATATITIS